MPIIQILRGIIRRAKIKLLAKKSIETGEDWNDGEIVKKREVPT